jgi:MFS family permease
VVDKDHEEYIDNWYTQMNMVCMREAQVAMLLSVYFVGFAFSGLFAGVADKFGRKKSLIFFASCHLVTITTIITANDYGTRLGLFFVLGLA